MFMIKKLVLIIVLSFSLVACQEEQPQVTEKTGALTIISADNMSHPFTVELALTVEEQATGLMHRTEMAEDAGMLFYFGEEAERGFWMKNTLIPLDMIFIRADGTIHKIHENAVPEDLTRISSNGPVAAVLEIKGGVSRKMGIKPGDRVEYSFFKQKTEE